MKLIKKFFNGDVGVWRSSSNYQGSKKWSISAKIAVIFNITYLGLIMKTILLI